HLVAAGDDAAGDLEAGNVLRSARRSRITARALGEIGRVDPGELGGDGDLVAPGRRVGALLEAELLSVEHDRPHRATVRDGPSPRVVICALCGSPSPSSTACSETSTRTRAAPAKPWRRRARAVPTSWSFRSSSSAATRSRGSSTTPPA